MGNVYLMLKTEKENYFERNSSLNFCEFYLVSKLRRQFLNLYFFTVNFETIIFETAGGIDTSSIGTNSQLQ